MRLALYVVVLVGFAVRVVFLEAPSLWIDEAISRRRALMPPSSMLADLASDHVPLYWFILRLWVRRLGSSVFSLRLPSVLLGTLVIPLAYALARILYEETTACIAAGIAATSPFLVFYSRMARPYPFLWVSASAAIVFYLMAWRDGRWRSWILYAFAAIVAACTHFTALPILGFLGFFSFLRWESLKPQISRWIAAHLLIVLALVPLLGRLLAMVVDSPPGLISRGTLTPRDLANVFVSWNLGHAFARTDLVIVLTLVTSGVCAGIGLTAGQPRWPAVKRKGASIGRLGKLRAVFRASESQGLLLGLMITPLLIGVAAKLLNPHSLPFSARAFSVASLPYYTVLAHGFRQIKRPEIRWPLVLGCGLVMMAAVGTSVDQGAGIDWRWVAEHIEQHEHPADLILVIPGGHYRLALETYYSGSATLDQTSSGLISSVGSADFISLVSGYPRAWVITLNDGQFDPDDRIGAELAARCTLSAHEVLIPRHARLRLFGECTWESASP